MANCEMCGGAATTVALSYHGMSVCEPCHTGKYGFRLDPLGIKIQTVAWSFKSRYGEVPVTEVRAMVPYPIDVEAMLMEEQLFDKLVKLFKAEVQIGNPAFDNRIYIRTNTPAATKELLQDADLQAAIVTAVGELESRSSPVLGIDHNAVVIKTQIDTAHDINNIRRSATLVALSLARRAQAAGLPRDDGLVRIPDFSGIHGTSPKGLIFSQTELQSLSPLTGLAKLEWLRAAQCRVLDPDLTPLRSLPSLSDISFEIVKEVEDLRPLSGMSQLAGLTVYGSRVSDLTPIAGLTGLTELNITESQVTDLTPIARLVNLQKLNLRNTGVADLSPLAGMAQLRVLNIRNSAVANLAPLHGLGNLTQIKLGGCRADDAEIGHMQRALRNAQIDQQIIEPNPPDLT